MSKKWVAFAAVLMLSCSIILANGKVLGAPQSNNSLVTLWPAPTLPAPTVIPGYTYPGMDSNVTIPDDKLRAALHTAAGLQPQAPISKSDLAKLSGGLDLSNKQIAKADGLQYCINVTAMNLSGNKLTTLPGEFSSLSNLQSLTLDGNKFTDMPDVLFSMPKLTSISLASNQLTKVPDKIGNLTGLTYLDVSGNDIATISTNISKCAALVDLDLSGNSAPLKQIPKEVCLLPNLENLDLSANQLSVLPDEIRTMPKLVALNVENNILGALPAGLGFAPSLLKVYAARNRLTIIDQSLYTGKITDLTLDVNRLTDLPTGLAGKTFVTFSAEWNFIDMSDGSDSRKIADSINASGGKSYLRQLKNIASPTVQTTINTVALKWQPLPEGTSGNGSWKINKYMIYLDNNGTWQDLTGHAQRTIAELDKLAGEYVVTGLKANTAYKFVIGVEYSLTLNGTSIPSHRYFTEVDAKTLSDTASADASAAPTGSPTPTDLATATPEGQATLQPEPTVTTAAPAHNKGGNKTLFVVLIIIAAVAAIAVVWIAMMLLPKRNKRKY